MLQLKNLKSDVIDVEDIDAVDTSVATWTCSVCTLCNQSKQALCEACGNPKSQGDSNDSTAVFATEVQWACVRCTFLNTFTANACDVCQERRPMATVAEKKCSNQTNAVQTPIGGVSTTLGSNAPTTVSEKGATCDSMCKTTRGVPNDLQAALHRLVDSGSFRSGQLEVVQALLAGEDVLYVFPTGAGKSLCYQLPALLSKGKFALVISPLIALMEDQIRSLRKRGISAVALHSELTAVERKDILAAIGQQQRPRELKGFFTQSANAPKLVYLSPELATSSNFSEYLRLWSAQIALVAIDEAPPGSDKRLAPPTSEIALQELQAVEDFSFNTTECRRRLVLRHFGDPSANAVKEWHAPDTCCDRCAEAAGTSLKGLENLSTSVERRRSPTPRERRERQRIPAELPSLQPASKAFPLVHQGSDQAGGSFVTARQLQGVARPRSPGSGTPKKKRRTVPWSNLT